MTALELSQRQRHYDRLHHLLRIRDFKSMPMLDHFQYRLLKQSIACVEGKICCYNSVDCDDLEYIKELDAFSKELETLENTSQIPKAI